jgi:hypothetical protein
LFTGLGEQKDAYGWLRAGEDMCGSPWNLISQEIVRKTLFNVFQYFSSTLTLPPFHSSLFRYTPNASIIFIATLFCSIYIVLEQII